MPTKIDWLRGTDGKPGETWNPFGWGCYGPGGSAEHPQRCSYCYARRLAKRKMRTCPQCQAFVPHWHPEQLDTPLHRKQPRRIFCGSMADPFAPWVTPEQLDAVLEVIAACPQHTFYMLTKWPGNIMGALYQVTEEWPVRELGGGDYLPNLWLCASIDTQARADAALHPMFAVACAGWHVFASLEPLLTAIGPIMLAWAEWQIIGAMSGPGADKYRPELEWVTHLMNVAVGRVPVFLKSSITALWPDLQRREWPQGVE